MNKARNDQNFQLHRNELGSFIGQGCRLKRYGREIQRCTTADEGMRWEKSRAEAWE